MSKICPLFAVWSCELARCHTGEGASSYPMSNWYQMSDGFHMSDGYPMSDGYWMSDGYQMSDGVL